MISPTVKLSADKHGQTLLVTLNTPPANTWDEESLAGLQALVAGAEADRDIRALVITGSGGKFFSAGADLKLFAAGDKGVARTMATAFGAAFGALANFRGVSIAALNGYAMGGGLECALACDLRIAEPQVQMALPEATVGLLPCGGGTQNLAWLVGEGWAKRMILCGERVNAETALRIGLVEEIAGTGAALRRALELAGSVCNQSPRAVAACKQLIQRARGGPMAAAHAGEREAFVQLFDSPDQVEGVRAFLEKRKPAWKDA